VEKYIKRQVHKESTKGKERVAPLGIDRANKEQSGAQHVI
jgi:hypothetical protein